MTSKAIEPSEFERDMRLLAWWGIPTDGAGGDSLAASALKRMKEGAAGIEAASAVQNEALAALGAEVAPLMIEAARCADPQAALDAQLEIAASLRRCGAACARAWASVALSAEPTADAVAAGAPDAQLGKSTAQAPDTRLAESLDCVLALNHRRLCGSPLSTDAPDN